MRTLQAVASVLRGDEQSRERGRFDALMGRTWSCPEGADMLAYSLGYADGETDRACCAGERAEPERPQ